MTTLPPRDDRPDHDLLRRETLAIERLARVAATALALGIALLIGWGIGDVVLLVFAALLLACQLRGGAEWLAGRIGGPVNLWLSLILISVVVVVGLVAAVRGPVMAGELHDIWLQIRQQATDLWARYGQAEWLQPVLGRLRNYVEEGTQRIAGVAAGVGTSTLGGLGSLLVIIVAAVFFAVDPELYVGGSTLLLPRDWRPRAREVLGEMSRVLRWWFVGQAIDMAAVGVLTGLGLLLIGVKLAVTLAVIAALFNFVPYIGALAGAVPAILIAFGQGPQTALWTAILFVVVQTLEGNVIAPLIQKRTVELAPVLTLLSQTVLGTLFGPLGLVLATPATAAAQEFVRRVYVEDLLGDTGHEAPAACGEAKR